MDLLSGQGGSTMGRFALNIGLNGAQEC